MKTINILERQKLVDDIESIYIVEIYHYFDISISFSDEEQKEFMDADGYASHDKYGYSKTGIALSIDLAEKLLSEYNNAKTIALIRRIPINMVLDGMYEYIKEYTYINGEKYDESIVGTRMANDQLERFNGRSVEKVKYKKGDIVLALYNEHICWGIVYDTPPTDNNCHMDYTDDSYTILFNDKGYMSSHEHILSHHVFPADLNDIPTSIKDALYAGYKTAQIEHELYDAIKKEQIEKGE